MNDFRVRVLICVLLSLALHWGSSEAFQSLPPVAERQRTAKPSKVAMRIVEPRPSPVVPPLPIEPVRLAPTPEPVEPEPVEADVQPKPLEPEPVQPKPIPAEMRAAQAKLAEKSAEKPAPQAAPKAEEPTANADSKSELIGSGRRVGTDANPMRLSFSLDGNSLGGPEVPAPLGRSGAGGNGTGGGKDDKGGAGDAPVATHQVETMPASVGRCRGTYNEAARAAGIEGTVVLDVVVSPEGKAQNITVVSGLGHGLDEAAINALKVCKFRPGTRGGVAVPVQIRSFKVQFTLSGGP